MRDAASARSAASAASRGAGERTGGLRVDGRAADREFPAWGVGGHLNARQEDYRDAVRGILAAMSAHGEESSDG